MLLVLLCELLVQARPLAMRWVLLCELLRALRGPLLVQARPLLAMWWVQLLLVLPSEWLRALRGAQQELGSVQQVLLPLLLLQALAQQGHVQQGLLR